MFIYRFKMWLLIGLAVAAYIFYVFVYTPMVFWKKKGVPHVVPVPFLGNVTKVVLRTEAFPYIQSKMYNQFSNERYFGMYTFSKPNLCIRDLDLIKQITIKDFNHFSDHLSPADPKLEPLVKNLINMKGNEWRRMRATLSPAFTASKMRGMYQFMSKCAENVTQYLIEKDVKDVDLKELFTKYTNDVIAVTSFGISCNSLKDDKNEFYQMGKKLLGADGFSTIKIILYLIVPGLMKALKVRILSEKIAGFFQRTIIEAKQFREQNDISRPDMLNLLMEAQKGALKSEDADDEKCTLSDTDIVAQALVFFFAGFETVATAISFMMYELAINPDVQEKLQMEIDDAAPASNAGALTYEQLLKLSYLDQVVSETLRKWPPSFLTDRVCVKEYKIQPVKNHERPLTIPVGMSITVPIMAMHYDPEYFPNPERFDPDRFSEENHSALVPGSYMPFGAGPRICIGSRFAILAIKTLAVHLLSKFNVTVTEKTQVPIKISAKDPGLAPEGGFWVGLETRKVT